MTKSELANVIIEDLGANFRDGDGNVIGALLDDAVDSALSISNRLDRALTNGEVDEDKLSNQLEILKPEIKKCVKTLYLQRGAEDVRSQSLSGLSSTYEDAMDALRRDIIRNQKRVLR